MYNPKQGLDEGSRGKRGPLTGHVCLIKVTGPLGGRKGLSRRSKGAHVGLLWLHDTDYLLICRFLQPSDSEATKALRDVGKGLPLSLVFSPCSHCMDALPPAPFPELNHLSIISAAEPNHTLLPQKIQP
ncbi:hypothetical protein EYF80_044730 [Liparis tanakae]|uniref:Uncharacterized protein n=1 Tax=Liparis tanakae TaxID=230148 RepID=A0A4Z2FW25_9TELE|nr:hypothetical protein EYF80_044730 [Liparis tanakae]